MLWVGSTVGVPLLLVGFELFCWFCVFCWFVELSGFAVGCVLGPAWPWGLGFRMAAICALLEELEALRPLLACAWVRVCVTLTRALGPVAETGEELAAA